MKSKLISLALTILISQPSLAQDEPKGHFNFGWGEEDPVETNGLIGHFNWGWEGLTAICNAYLNEGHTYLHREDYTNHAEQLLDRYNSRRSTENLSQRELLKLKITALSLAFKYGEDLRVCTCDLQEDMWDLGFSLDELKEAESDFLKVIDWRLKPWTIEIDLASTHSVQRGLSWMLYF